MSLNARNQLVKGFDEWIVGPSSQFEELHDYPALVYVSGMLFPRETNMDEEQNDEENLPQDKADSDSGIEGIPALVNCLKPSAAGFTFVVKPEICSVNFAGSFGLYIPRVRLQNVIPITPNPFDGNPAPEIPAGATPLKTSWHRVQVEFSKEIFVKGYPNESLDISTLNPDISVSTTLSITENESSEIQFLLKKVFLDVRRHGNQITLTLVNQMNLGARIRVMRDSQPPEFNHWFISENAGATLPAEQVVNCRSGRELQEKATLFQVHMEVKKEDRSFPFVEAPLDHVPEGDEDLYEHLLLYRESREISTGHGCGTDWSLPSPDGKSFGKVETAFIPRHEVLGLHYEISGFAGSKDAIFNALPDEYRGAKGTFDPESIFIIEKLAGDQGSSGTNNNYIIGACNGLCNAYESWVNTKETEIDSATAGIRTNNNKIINKVREIAKRNISLCREVIRRMRNGIATLLDNADDKPMKAFKLANLAMDMQAKRDPSKPSPSWRPFQLAFMLMSVNSLTKPTHRLNPQEAESNTNPRERDLMDLIWFPTGGGKTEAYLAVTALVLLHRRLRYNNPDDGAGVSVITRYTLRLLTSQQFDRASRLMCALELIRRGNLGLLGKKRFNIGLFVGGDSTPNKFKDDGDINRDPNSYRPGAWKVIEEIKNNPTNPQGTKGTDVRHLRKCPWCGTALRCDGQNCDYIIYNQTNNVVSHSNRNSLSEECSLVFYCSGNINNAPCPFNNLNNHNEAFGRGIPVQIVDDEILRVPPSVIIGTVDKFARLTWEPRTKKLFGRDINTDGTRIYPSPDLIIQDELHLISGPLGTIVGIYEAAIDTIATSDDSYFGRPKVIGSTATIRRAKEQVLALYDREVKQFPPPALTAGDSFFATTDKSKPGRLYLGFMAPAQSGKVAYQKSAGALLRIQKELDPNARDTFFTLVAYFNSLRELSGASILSQDNLAPYMETLGNSRSRIKGSPQICKEQLFPVELTSRMNAGDITSILERLSETEFNANSVRLLLATNMVSVGVDVPRLGLMLVHGMPKNTSEYIQATSRVGRNGPGLVVSICGWTKSRDRSHYEKFKQYHQSYYRFVEATSVTPWTSQVRDSALGAVMVTLLRHLHAPSTLTPPTNEIITKKFRDLSLRLLERIVRADPEETGPSREFIESLVIQSGYWRQAIGDNCKYGSGYYSDSSCMLRTPESQNGNESGLIPAANSMRDLEPSTKYRLKTPYLEF
jgi:hypothetical protein